jgi:hypothetical protein
MNSIFSLFSRSTTKKQTPRIYIDACTFDPDAQRSGEALILLAYNDADRIFERVSSALRTASAVVVVDQNSSDGTPFFAAEAGAVVVLQEQGQTREAALCEAERVARQFSSRVRIYA